MNHAQQPHLFAASANAPAPHERVSFIHDRDTGLQTILAIHDTRRGPAYGGCRITQYENVALALTDALRLAEGMSMKNALAELPFGGGKAVIMEPTEPYDRNALMHAFGDAVESLQGRYITAEDVGSTVTDMQTISERTRYVGGLPCADGRDGNPSPYTAYGVLIAMKAGVARTRSLTSMRGLTVAIQGLGAVGYALAELLAAEGAQLIVSDINSDNMQRAATALGATLAPVDQITSQPCDVLSPCAMGAVFNAQSIGQLQTPLICGAANNQLATVSDGDLLHQSGITYLPDYLVNAGGIICAGLEYLGQGGDLVVRARIEQIDERVHRLLSTSEQNEVAPHRLADQWARQLIEDPSTSVRVLEAVTG